ncbi:FHA domain-containing protein [Actinoallomurus acaciae]|uniref:FHA domain-containing protein n=1 Tax=Actinoallomurus acaciae TaxID=502577 RepID=A0ABV5YRX6_9ACTN
MEGLSARASDADRDRVLRELRDRVADGRLSHETFEQRVESALRARSHAELTALVSDLPPASRLVRGLAGAVTSLSSMTARLEAAWRAPRLPRFALPPHDWSRLLIGRAPGCQFVVTDLSVSRVHAELRRAGDNWLLADLGSMNGTLVNGYRIVAPTRVRPGDEIAFGKTRFILA